TYESVRYTVYILSVFFFSSRRRHTRCYRDWSSDVCSSDLFILVAAFNASDLVYRKEQMLAPVPAHIGANAVFNQDEVAAGAPAEIGRASCRERGEISVGEESVEEKELQLERTVIARLSVAR